MRVRRILPVLILVIAAVSCRKPAPEEPPAAAAEPVESAEREDAAANEPSAIDARIVALDSTGFKNYAVKTGPFRTEAHAKYLADPMVIRPLPDQGLPAGKTAVVGSKVCVFYPGAALAGTADLAKLPKGVPVPFGTIVPIIGEKVENADDPDHYGMFSFQDNWNWFYRTKWQGKDGLVFGADLYGLDDTNEDNRVSSRLYQTGGTYDAFHPVLGYYALPKDLVARLERDKLAIQEVTQDEYWLNTDDMIDLYATHHGSSTARGWQRKTPLFVTTDLAAHAQHLMFDRTLQYLEEAFFLPRLKRLNASFLARLQERIPAAGDYRETLDKAILYFQVAQALLDLAPDRVAKKAEYGPDEISYADKDREATLAGYPEAVRAEIAKMDAAEGFKDSAVFAFRDGTQAIEDYSQYKPRGHYTKNGALSAYFRAMMWFGRIHFLIADAGPAPLPAADTNSSDSASLTLAMEPIALLVTDIVKEDEDLYLSWRALFDPITALIGISDDLSFKEVLPLWKDQRVAAGDFGAWAADTRNLLAFMEKAHEKLRPPAISGSSVFWGPSEGADRKPPMGWRLFGQRFTYDSFVHQQVSPPRLGSRDMVRGLDIMKAFGSRTAENLLAASDYPEMDGLKERLDGLEKEFASYDADFWQRTYYNAVLFQVKAQAQFESGAGFYFTESPAWGVKSMLSSHGTWSELRHDTLLYAKQVYAERAGDGDFEPTFRTEEIPDPVHYVEPNVPFWQGSALSVQKFLETLDEFKLLDEETANAFRRLQAIYVKAADIAAAEAQDKAVSKQDVKWIAAIPAELDNVVLVHVEGGYIEDRDQLRMAVVADVFTNAELGAALETGVGIPYRIYVPLNDGQGGKRIAVGYCFSYYEFPVPMGKRMTDEAWKKIVYDPKADMGKYRPFWSAGVPMAPAAAGK